MAHRNLSTPDALRLAEAHLNAGQAGKAEELLRQVLKREPRHVEALNALGVMALNQGQLETAIELFERALAERPQAPILHTHLGEAHRRAGRSEKAAAHARMALTHRQDHPGALGVLSAALADQARALQQADSTTMQRRSQSRRSKQTRRT